MLHLGVGGLARPITLSPTIPSTATATRPKTSLLNRNLLLLILLALAYAINIVEALGTVRRGDGLWIEESRWEAARQVLEATVEIRRRFDHRSHKARLVGLFDAPKGVEWLIAVQPDRSQGRKLIFMKAQGGEILGHVLLESTVTPVVTSSLRGMSIEKEFRGRGYSKLFLAIWMRLCLEAKLSPSTNRINKPLLALTLSTFGFTPLSGEGQKKSLKDQLLVVEVSISNDAKSVLVYSKAPERLRFSATELKSQRLIIVEQPTVPRGKEVHLLTQYEFLAGVEGLDAATTFLDNGLNLGPTTASSTILTLAAKSSILRALYGRI